MLDFEDDGVSIMGEECVEGGCEGGNLKGLMTVADRLLLGVGELDSG